LIVLEQKTYLRVRKGVAPKEFRSRGHRTTPSRVGRTHVEDVLLNAAEDGLVLDSAHKWLFDHPTDHIPGMLIIEAARQAFALGRGGDPAFDYINARFFSYGELHEPVQLVTSTLNISDGGGCSFRFHQSERTLAVVDLSHAHDV
jgi:hypothetical protein